MANELSVTYEVDGGELTLNPPIVYKYLTGGRQDIPIEEVAKFIMLCKARKLNPFTGDVYMTSYNTQNGVQTSIITGKETFTKRAQRNKRFRGLEAGVSVQTKDNRFIRRDGSMVLPGETLVGGWARVYVDGWEKPSFEEVGRGEYDTGKSLWKSKPATMIRKVAVVHALREAFPDEFQGLYDASEMGVEQPSGHIVAPSDGWDETEAIEGDACESCGERSVVVEVEAI